MRPASRKEQKCLDALLALIAQGVEYPDAVWKASQNGQAIDSARLGDLYDEHCTNQRPAEPRDYLLPGV